MAKAISVQNNNSKALNPAAVTRALTCKDHAEQGTYRNRGFRMAPGGYLVSQESYSEWDRTR